MNQRKLTLEQEKEIIRLTGQTLRMVLEDLRKQYRRVLAKQKALNRKQR